MRRASAWVQTGGILVPGNLHRLHRSVTLAAGVVSVNGVSVLVTLSRRIHVYTKEHIPSCTGALLYNNLKKILNMYIRGGHMVKVNSIDMKFEKIMNEINMAIVNTMGEENTSLTLRVELGQ
jgi:hypothetical protein